MTAALTVLAGAFIVGWFVPRLLGRVDLSRRDPLLLMVAWLVSMVSVLLAAATGVLLLLLPDHGPGPALLAALHQCWSVVQHGSPPRLEALAGVLGAALLTAFAARLVTISVRGARTRVAKRQENLAVLRLAARSAGHPSDVLWLAHDRPLAFSMAGRPGVVVATEGLTEHLNREAVAAVLAHERAHLTGRHHLLLATTDTVRAAMPFVPLFRRAPQALRELAELAADVAAVRKCGQKALRTALLGVARHGAPRTSLAMAQDAVRLRLARLDQGNQPGGKLRRAVSCGLTGTTAAIAPFLTGAVLLLSIAVISCAFTP